MSSRTESIYDITDSSTKYLIRYPCRIHTIFSGLGPEFQKCLSENCDWLPGVFERHLPSIVDQCDLDDRIKLLMIIDILMRRSFVLRCIMKSIKIPPEHVENQPDEILRMIVLVYKNKNWLGHVLRIAFPPLDNEIIEQKQLLIDNMMFLLTSMGPRSRDEIHAKDLGKFLCVLNDFLKCDLVSRACENNLNFKRICALSYTLNDMEKRFRQFGKYDIGARPSIGTNISIRSNRGSRLPRTSRKEFTQSHRK